MMAAKPAQAKDRGKLSMNVISEICKTKIFYNCSHTTHTHGMSRDYKWVALKSGGQR